MATKIDTVTARDALAVRHGPYFHKIINGCFVGFRKHSDQSAGAWLALYRDADTGKRTLHSLGSFDTVTPADRFTAAKKAAEVWFAHLDAGGSNEALTVRDACERYVTHLRNGGREKTAIDADARFKRWVFPHSKFSKTLLVKLTPGIVHDWRMKLANANAIPQDKTKAATEPRSASSLNRDMSTLKAALNLAKEDGHATSSHSWDTKLKPVVNAGKRRDFYLSLDQRKTMIEHAPDDLGRFLRGLSMLPLRPGALAALTVGNFNAKTRELVIAKDKAGADRRIALPPVIAAFIVEQCRGKLPRAAIFTRANGMAWDKDSWKNVIRDAVASSGTTAGVTAYTFRHSTITDLISEHHLDTLTVAQLSGTSLGMIEKHYGHLNQTRASEALAKLAF
jgi:integrase